MKKIMFNDKYGLTRAVIEGRKTQTRRVISGLPSNAEGIELITFMISHREYDEMKRMLAVHTTDHLGKSLNIPYQVGEEAAIAQSYRDVSHEVFLFATKVRGKEYRAGWANKMFVKADLMPHRIKITNIRVERLQDISDEDCLKEGIIRNKFISWVHYYHPSGIEYGTPQQAFADLIDKTCGKGTWDSNPWVFVYDFELIK